MNQSIFKLVENADDLPSSNENMADLFYREVLPTRNVTDSASDTAFNSQFGGTNISIRWNLDNRTWWIPQRSYLKIDLEITKPGDGSSPLYISDQIAPNMGLASSLFNTLTMKMNDTTLCQISQYIPQCDAITNRIYNSSEWLNKSVGHSVSFWDPNVQKRIQDISKDGECVDEIAKITNENLINLEYNKRYEILNRSDLGLGLKGQNVNARVSIDADTSVITFESNNNFALNTQNIFQIGDILVFEIDGEEFKRTCFYLGQTEEDSFLVAPLGTRWDVDVNNQDFTLTLFRHNDNIKLYNTKYEAGFSLVGSNISIVDDTNVCTLPEPLRESFGDILVTSNTDNQANISGFLCLENNAPLTLDLASFEQLGASLAGNDNNILKVLKLSEFYRKTTVEELGLINVDAANGYAVTVTQNNESAKAILTLHAIGTALPVNLKDIFKIMDIVVFQTDEGGVSPHKKYGYVYDIIDSENIEIIGSEDITNSGDDGNADLNRLLYRLRYFPSNHQIPPNGINISKNKSKFDICWKPTCLSIFNYQGAVPGGTKFELELQALAQDYIGLGIETPYGVQKTGRNSSLVLGTDYQLLVKNVKLYVCQVQGPVVGTEDYAYYLNLNECRAHSRKIENISLNQTPLDVTSSSYALALAFQDSRATNKDRSDISVTKFHVVGENNDKEELSLNRYSIRFAGLSVPQPDGEIKVGDLQEFLCNQYIRNQLYTSQYFKNAGGESLKEWKERGVFFYHPFVRSAGNKESRAYVLTQFNDDPESGKVAISDEGAANLTMLLFEFYHSFALIKMKEGSVYSVQTANQ